MKFIHAPFTVANVDRQYKALAVEFHPDKGGSEKLMQQLNNERDEALKLAKEGKVFGDGKKRLAKKRVSSRAITINFDPAKGVELIKEINKLFKKFRG